MTGNVIHVPFGRAWIDEFDGIARRWRGNRLEVWKPGKGWEKAPVYRVLTEEEEDEREIEAMCATLGWVAEELDRRTAASSA
jgi:hypothetical protein